MSLRNILAWPFLVSGLMSLLQILVASLKLGHIPEYGKDPDPTAMGFEVYGLLNFIVWVIGMLSLFLWPITLLVISAMDFFNKKPYGINIPSLFAYAGGILLFILVKYGMPSQFLWVND